METLMSIFNNPAIGRDDKITLLQEALRAISYQYGTNEFDPFGHSLINQLVNSNDGELDKTLRDEFAMAAMNSILANCDPNEFWSNNLEILARNAYDMADAMLKARSL